MIVIEIAHQRRQPVRPGSENLGGVESTVPFSIKYPQSEWIFLSRNVQIAVAVEVTDDNIALRARVLSSGLEGSVAIPKKHRHQVADDNIQVSVVIKVPYSDVRQAYKIAGRLSTTAEFHRHCPAEFRDHLSPRNNRPQPRRDYGCC